MKSRYFLERFRRDLEKYINQPNRSPDLKQQLEQIFLLVENAFGKKEDVTDQDLVGIKAAFNSAINKAVGIEGEFAKVAKIIFNNITYYAHSPLKPDGSNVRYKAILGQTKQAATYGYRVNDIIFCLDPRKIYALQAGTKTYDYQELSQISLVQRYPVTEVRTVGLDTFIAAETLQKQGLHPVVLNMAARETPGGGAEAGGFAQEESLYDRSNYYLGLNGAYNKISPPRYPIPEFGGIYSPDVQVVRNANFEFIPPWSVSIIASAAYIASSNALTKAQYISGMEKKMDAILRIAASASGNHDCVVLGAFGCGAFKRDGNTKFIVADALKRVINRPAFSGVFKNITLAVIPDSTGNLSVFSEKFNFNIQRQMIEHGQSNQPSRTQNGETLSLSLSLTAAPTLSNQNQNISPNTQSASPESLSSADPIIITEDSKEFIEIMDFIRKFLNYNPGETKDIKEQTEYKETTEEIQSEADQFLMMTFQFSQYKGRELQLYRQYLEGTTDERRALNQALNTLVKEKVKENSSTGKRIFRQTK